MSLVFNDTSGQSGLVQKYEDECGFKPGEVSGNSTRLAKFVAAVNSALDDFIAIAIQADGTWSFDDSNHDDYPVITTDLVQGQRDYTFTDDGNGVLILEVKKVVAADASGTMRELYPVDVEQKRRGSSFFDGQNATGTPIRYDKLANGIFLDPIPAYDYDGGLELYVNREGSHFTVSDTTKKPGVPGIFHKYFYLKPAMEYARKKSLKNYAALAKEVLKLEGDESAGIVGDIASYFARRSRDEQPRLSAAYQDNR